MLSFIFVGEIASAATELLSLFQTLSVHESVRKHSVLLSPEQYKSLRIVQ